MPVRVRKIKSETQSSDRSNSSIKSIQEINPDDVFFYADQFQLFKKYYSDDPESEIADKIFATMQVLEHFRNNIMNSPFLSPRDQLSKCRQAFSKALSQHQCNTLNSRISKNQLTPSAYLTKILDIKKLLKTAFSNINIEEMIGLFNATRIEINTLVQSLSQIHQKLPNRDKEFLEFYQDFQKVKKTMVTQVNQLRDYHQSRRCTSLVKKNNYLLDDFKTMCKILTPKQSSIREKGTGCFNQNTNYLLEVKAGLLGLNLTQRIDFLMKKNKKQNENSDNESEDEDDSSQLRSRKSRESHKNRNRRNSRATTSNSKQSKKKDENSNSNDESNYYEYEYEEYEEEEEEEEIIEEEEEEEIIEEEEEEEEEKEDRSKRNRRSTATANAAKVEQPKNVPDDNKRSTRSSRATAATTATTTTTTTRSNRNQSNATDNRKQRGRNKPEIEDTKNDSKPPTAAAAEQNKRGRSRSASKSDTASTASSSTSSSSQSSAASTSRGRRAQQTGIAARFLESNAPSTASNSNSTSSSSRNKGSSASADFPSRRTRRRKSNEDNPSDNEEETKSKSSSASTSKENVYSTRSSRSRDKDGKENQSSAALTSSASAAQATTSSSAQPKTKAETKAQAQERKLVCSQIDELTKPLLEIIGKESFLNNEDENEEEEEDKLNNSDQQDFVQLIFNPLSELYKSEHPTESGLNSAFTKSYKEFKLFLDSMNFELYSIKIFFIIHEIEVYRIDNNLNIKNINQIISLITNLPDKLNKYQQVQYLEMIIELIEKLNKTINEESNGENYGKEPSFLLRLFEEIFNIITPIICLIKTITPFNTHIKTNKLTRSCEYLYIPYTNYFDKQTIHWQQYTNMPFRFIKRDKNFDIFIFNLCQQIETNGILIYNKSNTNEFNCLNVIIPKINELLKNIQTSLFLICANSNDDNLNQFSTNLLTKIYDICKIIDVEKSICKMKNSSSYSTLKTIVDFDSLLSMIKSLRDIHFLFVALDGRNVISYSNSLNLTYTRMFVEKICDGEDILFDQFLCSPIDSAKIIRIKDILNSSQIDFVEEKLRSTWLIRLKSLDYFPSNKYFITLYNIENIKTPQLKQPAANSSQPLYPPDLSDLVFNARLKSKKVDDPINEDEEISLVKNVLGIDKDFLNHNSDNDIVIESIYDIYLDLLELITIKDNLFVIPSSLSNFLALRSQSPDFAEKIKNIENFKEFVLIFNETFHLNVLTIINSIIKEIEEFEAVDQSSDDEMIEKVTAFLLLTIMKRGYLSTLTVSQFVKYITDENRKLFERFTSNENLMKSVLDLCKVVMFIDIHDKVIESMSSINNVSILRNLNLGLFCTSMARSLLYLNSTTTITLNNVNNFTVNDLTEMNKFGKFVLFNINEIDRFQKDELVESIKKLYSILPSSNDLANDLSEEKINKIVPEIKDKTFLKISCSNIKIEIDDFIRFQSDPNKRTMKMTSPVISLLLNSTTNTKNIVSFCICAFDVPKILYSGSGFSPSYLNSVSSMQQKRNERLRKVEENLEMKEMDFLASSESLLIPIPCSLLNNKQQQFMADYYQKLQEEREELVIKEKMYQEFLEKKELLLHQIQEQSVKRKELVEKFYNVKERLKQVALKAQQHEEMQRRRQEKDNLSGSDQPLSNSLSSSYKFENDAILASQQNKNHLSVVQIQSDLAILEQRTRLSLESNRRFKKMIDDLNKKYEDRQEQQQPIALGSSAQQQQQPVLSAAPSSAMKTSVSPLQQNDFIDLDASELTYNEIDDFVKKSLIEMNLASEVTFREIEKTANDIKKLEEGVADEEAHIFTSERIADVQSNDKISKEDKEKLASLIKEIEMLKNEKEMLQNNQG